jgi:hypothetical protein
MKTLQWLKNSKGEFEQVGIIDPKLKWVRIQFLDEAGLWQEVGNHEYEAQKAFSIIVSAIEKKQTGKWFGYRLAPVEKVESEAPKKKCGPSQESMDKFSAESEKEYLEQNKQEEVEMAKTKEAKTAPDKILGYFRKGTAMAAFIEPLLDEKPHKLSTVFAKAKAMKADPEFRLTVFRQKCKEKNLAGVLVDREADTIQIKIGKGTPVPGKSAKPVVKASPAPAKSAKKTNGSAEEPDVAVLVRKLLKKDGDWTKNKVVEKIHADHSIPAKIIQAAITSEIKGGGVEDTNGVLSLTAN